MNDPRFVSRYNVFFKELDNLGHHQICGTNLSTEKIIDTIDTKGCSRTKIKDLLKEGISKTNQMTNSETMIKIFKDISILTDQQAYCVIASRVKSVIGFVKVAYPDLIGGDGLGKDEPLNSKDRRVCRSKLLTCVERGLHGSLLTPEVVYDLDAITSSSNASTEEQKLVDHHLCNWDENRIGKRSFDNKHLHFESRFESGNLRKVIQVQNSMNISSVVRKKRKLLMLNYQTMDARFPFRLPFPRQICVISFQLASLQIGVREYDLILTPDVNSGSRHQWFYFEVSNMEALAYTFNIINCEKANSQFNFGMKPILFSVTEAQLGRPGWVRTGADICYYRNCYQRPAKGKNYLTTSFTVTFPHAYDVCYLAYHFPYTYSLLMTNIWKWTKRVPPNTYFRVETLCETLNGNDNPLLTITSLDSKSNPIQVRIILEDKEDEGKGLKNYLGRISFLFFLFFFLFLFSGILGLEKRNSADLSCRIAR